jgi:glycosyltransferase involved in cell wall biosynthesis
MTAGLPSVVTPAGDAGRIVQASRSGFVHAPDDETGMAATLIALTDSEAERARLGGLARAYVERELAFSRLRARLWRAYSATAVRSQRRPLLARLDAMDPVRES